MQNKQNKTKQTKTKQKFAPDASCDTKAGFQAHGSPAEGQ